MTSVSNGAYPASMRSPDDDGDGEGCARTEAEIRQVLEHARAGITRYGYGEDLNPADLARPWGNPRWQDNAWLRGVRDILERACLDLGGGRHPTILDLYATVPGMAEVMKQGSRIPVHEGWPPPQSAEAWDATLQWLDGRMDCAPACEHGGAYACGCQQLAAAAARGEAWAIASLKASSAS